MNNVNNVLSLLIELISEDSETDWPEVLKTALKDAEKFVLPLAIFKVNIFTCFFTKYEVKLLLYVCLNTLTLV